MSIAMPDSETITESDLDDAIPDDAIPDNAIPDDEMPSTSVGNDEQAEFGAIASMQSGHDDLTHATKRSAGETLEMWAAEACPKPWQHPIRATWWLVVNAAGSISIALLMAVVAAIPLVNFYVLGFLLDVQGRVARTGRVRSAFWMWGIAPRLGAIAFATWIFLVPVRIAASIASDAALVDPNGGRAQFLAMLTTVLAVGLGGHVLFALARGGKLTNFFRPIKNFRYVVSNLFSGEYWRDAGDRLAHSIEWLEFHRLWMLGLKGVIVGLGWLALPTALYVSAKKPEGPAVLVTIIGMIMLTLVNCWLPLLQANLAAEGTIRSGFALRTIRCQWAAAPLAWALAIVGLYVLTLPLHLFRVVLPPQDAAWLVTLVFVVTIFPTRIWLGYAAYRSRKRMREERGSRWWYRWPLKLVLLGLVAFYTFLLFFTQFIGTHGRGVLFEQHAFLVPWPM